MPTPPGKRVANSSREVGADVGVRTGEDRLDLLIDGLDDPAQVATRRAHVFELLLEERVPLGELGELLERERVDRTEHPQFALELAHPPDRCRALWHGRALGGFGDRRLDVEITAQRLDRGLESELRLRLLDVEPVRLLADDFELTLRVGALPAVTLEPGAERPHLLALAAALVGETSVLDLDHLTTGGDERR